MWINILWIIHACLFAVLSRDGSGHERAGGGEGGQGAREAGKEGQWSNGPTQRSARARPSAKAAETFMRKEIVGQDKSNNQAHARFAYKAIRTSGKRWKFGTII